MKESVGRLIIAMKYFGWWFAWGIFSTIMVFIVLKGGSLAFQSQLIVIFGVGVVTGLSGLFFYLKRG